MTFVQCEDKKQYPILRCVRCPSFPCKRIGKAELAELYASDRVEKAVQLIPRRAKRMYVFKKEDGSLVEAPRGFNPDKPDFSMLENVCEVLVIGKVLVKQVKLVVKPKAEPAVEPEVEEPVKRTRKKKAA